MLSPLPRRSGWVPRLLTSQPYQPSPIWQSGRPAHRPFRGLLGVHSRYGLHTRAATKSWHASPKASTVSLPPQLLRLLPAGAVAGWGSHPLESAAFARRTPTPVIARIEMTAISSLSAFPACASVQRIVRCSGPHEVAAQMQRGERQRPGAACREWLLAGGPTSMTLRGLPWGAMIHWPNFRCSLSSRLSLRRLWEQ